jgi:3-deoxy-manno-octulosonate cytidylyltransferase (CMP-KDO synthetase)
MKIVAIIPARLASTRFPRKVLLPIHGLPMIEHVRRRALLCKAFSDVYVATCDEEISDVVQKFGGQVIVTSDKHINGTTRSAEAVEHIDCTHVMLLQGDEPLLLPRHLDVLASAVAVDPSVNAWNITGPIDHYEELDRHSFVKCAVSPTKHILYCFRRSPCYSDFDKQKTFIQKLLGFIVYRKDFLLKLTTLQPSLIEQAECIEQMRIIENGFSLKSVLVNPSLPSINEPHEVKVVLDHLDQDAEQLELLKRILI